MVKRLPVKQMNTDRYRDIPLLVFDSLRKFRLFDKRNIMNEKSQSERNREALTLAMDNALANKDKRPLWKRAILSQDSAKSLMEENYTPRSYDEIDPGMYPTELAECLLSLANEYEEGAGESECKHKDDVAKKCRKIAKILVNTAEKLRKLDS